MKNTLGFSLVELMLVMALAAAFLRFAIPSYQLFTAKTHIKLACQQITRAISTAREAALNHHRGVILCGSRTGHVCDSAWSEGQRVSFVGARKGLVHFPPLPIGIRVEWRANLGRNQVIEFTPEGLSAGQWGSFWLENQSGTVVGRVTVNAMGRVSNVIASEAGYPRKNSL